MAPSKKEVAKKEVAVVGSNAVAAIDAAQVSSRTLLLSQQKKQSLGSESN
jgi:ribosome biogenesis protein UTP30